MIARGGLGPQRIRRRKDVVASNMRALNVVVEEKRGAGVGGVCTRKIPAVDPMGRRSPKEED